MAWLVPEEEATLPIAAALTAFQYDEVLRLSHADKDHGFVSDVAVEGQVPMVVHSPQFSMTWTYTIPLETPVMLCR